MASGVATDEKWTIEKLDGANWTTWNFPMKHLLLAEDLWEFVDGTEPPLAKNVKVAVRVEYRKRLQKAFPMIVLAIST